MGILNLRSACYIYSSMDSSKWIFSVSKRLAEREEGNSVMCRLFLLFAALLLTGDSARLVVGNYDYSMDSLCDWSDKLCKITVFNCIEFFFFACASFMISVSMLAVFGNQFSSVFP